MKHLLLVIVAFVLVACCKDSEAAAIPAGTHCEYKVKLARSLGGEPIQDMGSLREAYEMGEFTREEVDTLLAVNKFLSKWQGRTSVNDGRTVARACKDGEI